MIKEGLEKLRQEIPEHVTLVAVSKTKPTNFIHEAYTLGQRVFGENKAQEMAEKAALLPKDIQWHFIGHLQSNKVKYIAPFVDLIHSVDSLKLLKEINKQGTKHDRVISCLLQFHIAQEDSKFGLSLDEARNMLASDAFQSMNNVSIEGIMGMATLTSSQAQIRHEFKVLRNIFETLREEYFRQHADFQNLSMGMSGDYTVAIEEGSTMIRLGSAIFGKR